MQKDELIQFHMFLLQLKNHLEEMVAIYNKQEFNLYDKLNITPYQIYKSKREHELAVFILSNGIANLLTNNNFKGYENISNKLSQISERFISENDKRYKFLLKWNRFDKILMSYISTIRNNYMKICIYV